ncbi:4165_t:CDS:2, partial [Funneliformis geosporum]
EDHPAVVVSNNWQNEKGSRVVVLPMSSKIEKIYPFDVYVGKAGKLPPNLFTKAEIKLKKVLAFEERISHLAEGHNRGGFDLKFTKPVKEFIDVYACIGCRAPGKKGEPTAEELNRDIPGYGFQFDSEAHGDSLDNTTVI